MNTAQEIIEWSGYVSEVLDDGFVAIFEGKGDQGRDVVADFDLADLCADDREILLQGMPLVWCVSQKREDAGTNRAVIRLVRALGPSAAEISAASRSLDAWVVRE